MNLKLTKLRKVIAGLVSGLMILQLALPFGPGFLNSFIPKAFAATSTWEFNSASDPGYDPSWDDYAYDSAQVDIISSKAQRKLSWTASGDSDLNNAVIDLLETNTTNRVLAVIQDLANTILYSTDAGATWSTSQVYSGADTYRFYDMAKKPSDGRVVLVGYKDDVIVDDAASFYSDNHGATWTGPVTFEVIGGDPAHARSVVWDSNNSQFWAGTDKTDTDLIYISPDGDDDPGWSNASSGTLANATNVYDILPVSSTVLYAAVSTTSLGNNVFYTTDSGGTWALTDNLGGTVAIATSLALGSVSGRYQNILFVGTYGGKIFKSSDSIVTQNHNWSNGLGWTDINITNASRIEDIYLGTKDNILLTGIQTGTGAVFFISSDGGSNWSANHPQTSDGRNGPIIRLSNTGIYLVGTYVGAGDGEVYSGSYEIATPYEVVNNTGVSFASLSGFTVTVADSSEYQAPYLFYFVISATTKDGPWYWYDYITDNQWEPSSGFSQSNNPTTISENIKDFMTDLVPPISTGTFFFKTFMTGATTPTTNPAAHLDSVAIDYTAATVTITQPNGGPPPEVWKPGEQYQIKWDKTGTIGGDGTATIYHSIADDWGNKVQITDSANGNSGSYKWTIRSDITESKEYKIRIVANSDSSITDDSDNYFTIEKGGVEVTDKTPPQSSVDPLPSISLAEKDYLGYYIIVTATAIDPPPDASGVDWVDLYFRKGLDPGNTLTDDYKYGGSTWFQNQDGHYYWNFRDLSSKEREHYFFFSVARDNNGNIEAFPPTYDAETTVDLYSPFISSTDPERDAENVDIDKVITLYFSEAIECNSFEYEISPSVSGTGESWFEDLTWVNIYHDSFTRNTTYKVTIKGGKDLAGRDLVGLPYSFSFTTIPPLNPDLSGSKWNPLIEKDSGEEIPGDNKLKPGKVYRYSFDVINSNTDTAYVAWYTEIPNGTTAWGAGTWKGGCYLDGNKIRWGTPDNREELPGNSTRKLIFYLKVDKPQDNGTPLPSIALFTDGVHDFVEYEKELILTPTVDSSPIWNKDILTIEPQVLGRGQSATVTAKLENSGDMNANILASLPISNAFEFVQFKQDNFGNAQWDKTTSKVTWSGWVKINETAKVVQFEIKVKGDASPGWYTFKLKITVTNSGGFDSDVEKKVEVKVQKDPPPPYKDLFILETEPADGDKTVPLYRDVKITFSKAVGDTSSFNFEVAGGPEIDKSKWKVSWNEGKTEVSLKHSEDPFVIGSDYRFKITLPGLDERLGKPNPWSFSTIYPALAFTKPYLLDPGVSLLLSLLVNKVSPLIEDQFKDKDTKQLYKIEQAVDVRLNSTSLTGGFDTDPEGDFAVGKIPLAPGDSQIDFYYKDPTPSPQGGPYTITINSTDPKTGFSLGWLAALGYFVVSSQPDGGEGNLQFTSPPQEIVAGQFSQAFTLEARDKDGNPVIFPEDTEIYLHSPANRGAFYNEFHDKLPYLSGSGGTVQVLTPPEPNLTSLTFYFRSEDPGQFLITASDNYPLNPDTGYSNAYQIVKVLAAEEEEEKLEEELKELELEEVKDESGRVLDWVSIDPTKAYTLPRGTVIFEAEGFDTEGKKIENLKFFWFVINGGGTILEKGREGNSGQSAFTAGSKAGIYFNTVLVATKYNGVIKGMTATVYVGDITDFGGPVLPSTGPNGLQWFFIGFIFMAAVALAWVEHYDKTHFAEGKVKG